MDDQAGEQLLLALCRASSGDVHLDLAELDSVDMLSVIALLRGAAGMRDGQYLVLHNPPTALRQMLEAVGDATGDSGVRVE
ncbi:MAG TPA: STAS domain-containing protein [Actinophytocola sp.]|jgi:hypothetical protein|uniref:STAS domain-containing protein n=1 Tax=Actinophytocola sp. TaxID=1872138 RepID=UPI002E048EB0|nr:STAS domain-containing protein [Actinophytocola sp.]